MVLNLPNTGMATAIDLGEANDIHPKNKLDVGRRLGLAAMKIAYGKNVVHTGPVFRKMTVQGDSMIIEFDYMDVASVKDKYGYICGFQMAGDDQQFFWAKAYSFGNTVIVKCTAVPRPVAVRYAWDDNPGKLDLYNQAGLPALPFRTDSWKGLTADNVFVEGPRF
jgi:sialate O-acetylesterase